MMLFHARLCNHGTVGPWGGKDWRRGAGGQRRGRWGSHPSGKKPADPPVRAPTRYEPGATVTAMTIKGLIGRNPAGGLNLSK
jgi:hypothetical protein